VTSRSLPGPPPGLLAQGYRQLMAAFPTGVAVVASFERDGRPWGMTCSALCSVTLDPPTLLVCLRNGGPTLAAVRHRRAFTVNLLHRDARATAELFASGDPDRFARTRWSAPAGSAGPHLVAAAHAVADCRVSRICQVGDHAVVFGEVYRAVQHHRLAPLLYGLHRYAIWPPPGDRAVGMVTGVPEPPHSVVVSPVDVLRSAGAEFTVLTHQPIVGQADAEQLLGLPTGQLLKTMVFRTAAGGFILAALPAGARVSYRRLSTVVEVPRAKLRQADPADLAALGMQPGGASPVCGRSGVVTVFDPAVAGMGVVYCGSGRADQTVRIAAEVLIQLVGPRLAAITAD